MAVQTSVEEANKALFHRWFGEVWNKGNFAVAQEVIDGTMTVHGAGGQSVRQGPDGVADLVRTWRTAFPDGAMSIDDLIAEGDLVVARIVWRGTHTGDFYGTPPSGKKVRCSSIGIDRIREGKIAEGWGELNMLGLLQQVGAMPGPPQESPPPEPGEPTGPRGTKLSPAAMKAIFRRFLDDVWNKGHLSVADEVFAPDSWSPSAPDLPRGPEGVKAIVRLFREAFPDYHLDVDLMIAEGDQVAARFTQSGTHKGELFGIKPTGKKVTWTEIGILRFYGDQVAVSWYEPDMLTLMQQLTSGNQQGQATADAEQTDEERRNVEAVIARITDINSRRIDNLDQHYTEDYVEHNSFGPSPPGLEGVKQVLGRFLDGIPDQHFEVADVFAEGDRVVVRGLVSGTHQGMFFGIPPTNKHIDWEGIEICRMRDGRVAERWLLTSALEMMQQMGVGAGAR